MSGVNSRPVRLAACAALLAVVSVSFTGCLGYPVEGAVATPGAPGQQGESRLPSLLSQLQGGGASMELFDGTPSAQVLAAQDSQGKTASTPEVTQTVAGAKTPGTTTTPATGTPRTSTPTRTPTTGAGSTPTPTQTASPTVTATSTATPTATPTSTPTVTPTIPSEGAGATSTPQLPPTEG